MHQIIEMLFGIEPKFLLWGIIALFTFGVIMLIPFLFGVGKEKEIAKEETILRKIDELSKKIEKLEKERKREEESKPSFEELAGVKEERVLLKMDREALGARLLALESLYKKGEISEDKYKEMKEEWEKKLREIEEKLKGKK
ncbi:MAG TPA: hypothetical protein ENF65_01495 [Euryarchaeota archaeon]|nr:MAG: hypothetical protein DRN46_04380 [Thermococci archaeon]HDI10401.1 hypothetical protein [Euryarchaeota archaeon]